MATAGEGTYLGTHSWLTFSVNLERAHPRLWIQLGECQSKCEHIAGVPLRPSTADELHKIYLAKGALASTAIEGNSLSEEQVRQHLEGKLKLPASKEYLRQELDNVITECNRILEEVKKGKVAGLTPARIMAVNAAVLKDLRLDPDVLPGKLRGHSVTVGRYRGAPAQDCLRLLEKLCSWLNGPTFAARPGMEIVYAIVKAVLTHLYLAWIHPFGDGNGRTARLLEFEMLLGSGVPAPAAHLLSNHYNQTRAEYYRQLDAASRSGGDVLPFLEYAAQGLLDGLKEQLQAIRTQQWDVAWRNYVHEEFADRKGRAAVRRRHLALDLSARPSPVVFGEIAGLSPRLAAEYARKTSKTVTRDLNALLGMQLVERVKGGYRARRELILAFLPVRAVTSSRA